ncbi:SUMF1/EgtB/PvdO family nonheme iron enzyme [Phaeodactylibacter xiamenensis]|uniref:SUMF1/EgtB/PvdO family nonheme iron enzyme n=1 Tax=Phaeodactylibacter xiamenensis TaxID=1524460 RepID=UPI003CCBF79A
MPEQHKGLDHEAMQQMALQQQGHTHLLVIGVDAYAHCPPLSNCVKDAKDFTALMQQQYQVSPERTYELYDAQATRTQVLRQLKNLRHKVQEDDSLIVYFSGHGEIEDGEGYWIPIEGKPGEDEGWIAASSIKRRLNQVESFHTLVIADACFAGSFFMSYKNATRQLLHSRRSRLGISASHSRERALDGQAGDNSPFAKELLRALRHNQQPLPVDQLFTQVRDAVATVTQGRQTPIFKNIDVKGDDQGQFVFVPAITEAQAWAACQKAGTVAAYEAFLAQFSSGRHQSEAKEMLRFLKEENAWQTARQGNSIAAYLRYQDTYPQGRYFAQSVQAIADLEDAQDWAAAQGRNTIAAYLQYQTRHPNGHYRAQAQQAVQRLRREMAAPTPAAKPKEEPKPAQFKADSKPPPAKPPQGEHEEIMYSSSHIPVAEQEGGYTPRYRWILLIGLIFIVGVLVAVQVFNRDDGTQSNNSKETISPSENSSIPDFKMVQIPGGTFTMGCQNEVRDGSCSGYEMPAHQVTLSTFYLSTYEVTQAQWKAVMGNNPSHFEDCPNCPVEQVSWDDVQEFIKKLNTKTGEQYRLPTEAEWEYAARGEESGAQDNYLYSGSNDLDQVGWYGGNSDGKTHPVGQKQPNQLGLYDMSGNVWEWVQDCWHEHYSGAPRDGGAWLEDSNGDCSRRVLRGGSWYINSRNSRVANRNRLYSDARLNDLGFRLARD